jgi:hypothetical protein
VRGASEVYRDLMAPPDPVPPAVRAQLLATEHWSLLATRSQTWSEVMSRIMGQFTFTSASLVVLALVVQQDGVDGDAFRPLALGLGAAVALTGSLTTLRVLNASMEDAMLVRGMNRLRHAYVELDPGIAPYLVAGTHDDRAGLGQTYTMGPQRDRAQVLASAGVFSLFTTTLVVGCWVGLLAVPLGTPSAVMLGVLAAAVFGGGFLAGAARGVQRTEADPGTVRFPTPSP